MDVIEVLEKLLRSRKRKSKPAAKSNSTIAFDLDEC